MLVLNGPNLNLLGTREPEVYGTLTLADLSADVERVATELGLTVECRQSDSEADLVGWLHEAARSGSDVVLNPAAFTHYSYALRDACAHAVVRGSRVVEVHLTNPAAREAFRHTSVVGGVVTGTIAGFGAGSYLLALHALASH